MPTTTALAWLVLAAAAAAGTATAASTRGPSSASTSVVVESLLFTEATRADAGEWLQRLFGIELGPAERRCANESKILHIPTNRCYDLYHQGPCRAWEWLVADREAATATRAGPRRLRGACVKRPCAPSYGFLADENVCRLTENLCPSKLVFQYNLFGEGSCQCKGLRAAPLPGGPCHRLFGNEGCGKGRVLVPRFNLTGAFGGQCVARRCSEEQILMERPGMARECRAPWEADCVPHAAGLFTAETDLSAFLCVNGDRAVVPVPSRPAGCAFDNSGRCAKTVVRSEEPFDWFLEEAEDGPRSVGERGGGVAERDPIATAASSASAAYLERYLSPYALFSLIFF